MNVFVSISKLKTYSFVLSQFEKIDGTISFFSKKHRPSENEILREIGNASVLIIGQKEKITHEFFDNNITVKYIYTLSAGFDHIDVKAAEKKGIKVVACPGINSEAVADYTFREIRENRKRLDDQKVLIVGAGNISRALQRKILNLVDHVFVWTLHPSKYKNQEKISFVQHLESSLRNVDIISVNIPLSDLTTSLLKNKHIPLLKENVLLINTARAEILEDEFALNVLEKNKSAKIVLDVAREKEKNIKHERIKITNHIAGVNLKVLSEMICYVVQRIIESEN